MPIFRNKTRILTSLDKDARNFIDAAGLNTDSNLNVSGLYTAEYLRMEVSLFVKDLKNRGLWNKYKAIWIQVGGTSATTAINLKNPALYNLIYSGSWSFNHLGAIPSTSNSYARTNFLATNFNSTTDMHYSYFTTSTANTGSNIGVEFGCPSVSSPLRYQIQYGNNTTDVNMRAIINESGQANLGLFSNNSGYICTSRTTGSNSINTLLNDTSFTRSVAPLALESYEFVLNNSEIGGVRWSNRRCSLATIGDSFTLSEILLSRIAIYNFQRSLLRI